MMKESIRINPADTVAVALQDLPGIPAGHKFALRDIEAGPSAKESLSITTTSPRT